MPKIIIIMEKLNVNEVELNGVVYIRKDTVTSNKTVENTDGLKYVLIRSYGSGVHIGYLKSEKFESGIKIVTLVNTRRVFYWAGAASLSQLALEGTTKPAECKISVELGENEVVNVIETIPLTEKAATNLNNVKIWKL